MTDSSTPQVSPEQKLALVTLTKEILQQVSVVAALKRGKRNYGESMEVLREMGLILEYIPEHLQYAYLEMLPVIASNHHPLKPVYIDEAYVRLSTPHKRGIISRISSELSQKSRPKL